ncbi:MAG TPA: MarR family transcriptional regulator [Xanthobacteraceae bacterium]|nr:MarR family transcriptional regulator [Xanthobacteraceae bacterium]
MAKRANPPAKKHPAPSVPATAGLGFYLREAYRAFSREFHVRLAQHGITHSQWVMLWFLSQAGSLTPLELSRRAGIQKASATSVIDALKKRRLIRGDQDSVDRRKINLHLTAAGAELMKALIACAAETNAEAREGFSEKEFEALMRLLRAVTANLGGNGSNA